MTMIKRNRGAHLHRADLQRVLLDALPGKSIHLGYEFTGCQHEHGAIRVNFTSQSPVRCDVLIGADGLHSQLRDQMLDGDAPSYRGYTVWRGVTGRTPKELEPATAIEIQGRGQRFGIGPVGNGRIGWWASANRIYIVDTEAIGLGYCRQCGTNGE